MIFIKTIGSILVLAISLTATVSSISDEDDIFEPVYSYNDYDPSYKKLVSSRFADIDTFSSSEEQAKYLTTDYSKTALSPKKRTKKRKKKKVPRAMRSDLDLNYSAPSSFLEKDTDTFDKELNSLKHQQSNASKEVENDRGVKNIIQGVKRRTKGKKRKKKLGEELSKSIEENENKSISQKGSSLPLEKLRLQHQTPERIQVINNGNSNNSKKESMPKLNPTSNQSAAQEQIVEKFQSNSSQRKFPYEYGSGFHHQRHVHSQNYQQYQETVQPKEYPVSPLSYPMNSNIPKPSSKPQTQKLKTKSTSRTLTQSYKSKSQRISPSRTTSPASIPSSTSGATTQWIRDYLSSHRRDHLLPVPRDFIVDGFNLQKLQDIVESHAPPSAPPGIFKAALRLILDQKPQSQRFMAASASNPVASVKNQASSSTALSTKSASTEHLFSEEVRTVASEILYPLLHSRFILSPRGLLAVSRAMKQSGAVFGRCPRQFCKGMPLLPCGLSDCEVGRGKCMRYCCSCGEVCYMYFIIFSH